VRRVKRYASLCLPLLQTSLLPLNRQNLPTPKNQMIRTKLLCQFHIRPKSPFPIPKLQ
jgi:hypothetical protein